MSLSIIIDKVYEKFKSEEFYEPRDLKSGRLFITRLQKDLILMRKLLDDHDLEIDKRGWLVDEIFPITVDIINREKAPGNRVYVGHGHIQICVVYYGICPELSNFVTIVLWPKESDSSRRTYKKIYDLIEQDKDRRKVILFRKKYGLFPPNELHPFWDKEIDSIDKPKAVYEWKYCPYLKEVGDTITSHKSPVNFRKIFIKEDGRRFSRYVNFKVTIGRILGIRKDEVKILIPSLFSKNRVYVTKIAPSIYPKMEKQRTYYFLISERAEENVESYVEDFAPAEPVDVLAFLLSFSLYILHLGFFRLRVASEITFKRLFDYCVSKTTKFCRTLNASCKLWTPKNILISFLSPFFRMIGGNLFYVPYFLINLEDETLELFDQRLLQRKATLKVDVGLLFDKKGMLLNLKKLNPLYEQLRFFMELKKFIWWSEDHYRLYKNLLNLCMMSYK